MDFNIRYGGLWSKDPNHNIVVVGGGDEGQVVARMFPASMTSEEALEEHYAGGDVFEFVLPYEGDKLDNYPGFPDKVREAAGVLAAHLKDGQEKWQLKIGGGSPEEVLLEAEAPVCVRDRDDGPPRWYKQAERGTVPAGKWVYSHKKFCQQGRSESFWQTFEGDFYN